MLAGEKELERSSAEVLIAWQHLLRLGARLRAGFDATRLLGKPSSSNTVSLGLPRNTLKFNSFSLMSLMA